MWHTPTFYLFNALWPLPILLVIWVDILAESVATIRPGSAIRFFSVFAIAVANIICIILVIISVAEEAFEPAPAKELALLLSLAFLLSAVIYQVSRKINTVLQRRNPSSARDEIVGLH